MRSTTNSQRCDYDVVVVGGGTGGIYAVHRFTTQGLSVLGIEAAPNVGGVWYHNGYPGSRVDLESYYYCYMFDPALYREWKWTERYASQPEILAYLNHVADRYDVRRHFRFNTRMTGALWDPDANRYTVTTDAGDSVTARYVVMTAGQLSTPREPDFDGLDDFAGDWFQTSTWPQTPVELEGKRIGVIGTGSSGVQVVAELCDKASELKVFQRTANYSVPAHNGPMDQDRYDQIGSSLEQAWQQVLQARAGTLAPPILGKAADYSEAEQLQLLEERWAFGGQPINALFLDQGSNQATNDLVANFVRSKVRAIVKDPDVAAKLVPNSYPIGVRRVAVDTGYYEAFNRDNVTLVDIKSDPIRRLVKTGIETRDAHHELDVIIFALGFNAFMPPLDRANIHNEHGRRLTDSWDRGPQTLLGLMTAGFPNVFLITGPGSPGVLANVNATNVHSLDFVADLMAYMGAHDYARVEPTLEAQAAWTQHVNNVAEPLIRRQIDNYMVHVNRDDNSRIFIPYPGGFDDFVRRCSAVAEGGYEGFAFHLPKYV